MTSEPRSFVVMSGEAGDLRRRLKPAAWAVLEEVLARSAGPTDDCAAVVSVRSLAAGLGLSKDTVARALTRLNDAGIVVAEQQRASTGTFTAGTYRIAVPSCFRLLDVPSNDRMPRSRRAPTSAPIAAQLSLLD